MSRSLGMAAYSALARRAANPTFAPSEGRPEGEIVWLHAAETDNLLAIVDLAQRICAARHGLNALITTPEPASFEVARSLLSPQGCVHLEHAPSEHPDAVRRFFEHWKPDVGLWLWGGLRPLLISHALDAGCPMALVDADTAGFDGRRDRWLPDLARSLLDRFFAVFVRSGSTLRRLQSLGVPSQKVNLLPPLQAGGSTLPCEDSDLADLSDALSGRPVWLATGIQDAEVQPILTAHRQALRLSHRLLLVLIPTERTKIPEINEWANKDGFRLKHWSDGEYPDDSTQILLVDGTDDIGLFYRVAPVSFLGSSLTSGHGGLNPFEAASLGSAVLYGPNVRRYMPFYTRLANAGAARTVNDAISLGTAVTRLIAPDQAALMAHAGWDVISEGAALTDRVIEMVEATLDGEEIEFDARA